MPSSFEEDTTRNYDPIGLWVIDQKASGVCLGLTPLQPGSEVTYLSLGNERPTFTDASPFTSEDPVISGDEYVYTIRNDASGEYEYTIAADGNGLNRVYAIHVEAQAANQEALFRWYEEPKRLNAVLVHEMGGDFKLNFTVRQNVTDQVTLTTEGVDGNSDSVVCSAGDTVTWYCYDHTPNSYQCVPFQLVTSKTQVLGGEDADLDIHPDPNNLSD